MSGPFRPLAAAVLLSLATLLAVAPQASAAQGGPQVVQDDVTLTLDATGTVQARETIVYNFAGTSSFTRTLMTRIQQSDTKDRVYKITQVMVSSPDGGPENATITDATDHEILRVSGKSGISGQHTVVLDYQIKGAVGPVTPAAPASAGAQEIRWIAVSGWEVPVQRATVEVTTSSNTAIRSLGCFAGALDSQVGCTRFFLTGQDPAKGAFAEDNMLPGDNLTVAIGYPAGTNQGQPIFERRHTLSTAFSVNSLTGSGLLALLVLLLGGFGVLYQLRGRDARTVTRRATDNDPGPSPDAEFAPPSGARPGQIGTLIDEQADVLDVTATVVDLAVRGYLMILEEDGDWRLVKLQRPGSDLLRYERILYDALFENRTAVALSELGGSFANQLIRVRRSMYDEVVRVGWFTRRPDAVRRQWTTAGWVVTGLGVIGTVLLAIYTELALTGLALIIAGVAIAIGGRHMPAKTSRGTAVVGQTVGFRSHLVKGDTPPGIAEPQKISIFSRYLPYAVVFDCVPQWAKTVEAAGITAEGADNLYWYNGPAEWNLATFPDAFRAFTATTSAAISQGGRPFRAHT